MKYTKKEFMKDMAENTKEIVDLLIDGETKSKLPEPVYWYSCLLIVLRNIRGNVSENAYWDCVEVATNEVNDDQENSELSSKH